MFIAVLSLALGAIACTKNNPTYPNGTVKENSFVANGEGSTNEKFVAYAYDSASVAFDSSGRGVVVMTGTSASSSDKFILTIIKKSATTGSNQILDQTYMVLIIERNGISSTYNAITGSVTVNVWENVGGRCSGSFSGSFARSDKPFNTVLQVTAGYFYSVRI
jgi:hypothetical protein